MVGEMRHDNHHAARFILTREGVNTPDLIQEVPRLLLERKLSAATGERLQARGTRSPAASTAGRHYRQPAKQAAKAKQSNLPFINTTRHSKTRKGAWCAHTVEGSSTSRSTRMNKILRKTMVAALAALVGVGMSGNAFGRPHPGPHPRPHPIRPVHPVHPVRPIVPVYPRAIVPVYPRVIVPAPVIVAPPVVQVRVPIVRRVVVRQPVYRPAPQQPVYEEPYQPVPVEGYKEK